MPFRPAPPVKPLGFVICVQTIERQYRGEKRAELLEASNQATAVDLRAEALALHGRNLKTLRRLDFEARASVADRREKATSRNLTSSNAAYRKAYLVDLNNFYSGLADECHRSEPGSRSAWEDAFEDNQQATAYKSELGRQVEALRSSVRLAIDGAVERLSHEGKGRLGANIGRAALLFLTEERD